ALSAEVALPRGMIRLLDVAGLDEEGAPASTTSIGGQMRERALRALESADLVLLVRDVTDARPALALPRDVHLTILTKLDLLPSDSIASIRTSEVGVSAVTG